MSPVRFLGSVLTTAAVCVGVAPLSPAGTPQSWIANVSVLADVGPAAPTTLGYVVSGGTGQKTLLIRGAGPSLGSFGVPNPLPDPKLELFCGAAKVGENDNWQGHPAVAEAIATLGAFPFASAGSSDAALVAALPAGANSIRLSSADGRAGAALGEIYDATPVTQFTATTPRLINVSVLKRLQGTLTVGFVVAGTGTKTVLVRAVGPTLAMAPFAVPATLDNPRVTVFAAGQRMVAANDDWGGAARLVDAFAATGAFALPPHSRDAALLVELAPGSYTAIVDDAGGAVGNVLVEVYEVAGLPAPRVDAAPFTIAVLPDTQYYTKPGAPQNGELAMFTAQTDWIQAQHEAENIVYVAHVGDISDDGDAGGAVPAATQWANAVNAMARLERPVSIPYGMAVGNHDEEPNGDPDGTTTRFNENFGVARFSGRAYYGGHYGTNNDNHFDVFTAAGRRYLAVFVKYDAANAHPEYTSWANEVVASHPDHQAILVTHYMAGAGSDYSSLGPQGARLLSALKPNSNLFLALGGHVSGVTSFRRDTSGPYGRQKVTTLVADYQFEPRGGAGYLRLYTIDPDAGYLRCRSYSPFLGQFRTDAANEYVQSLAPRGPAEEGVVVLSDDRVAVAAVLSKVGTADIPAHSAVAVSFQQTAKANAWTDWRVLEGAAGFHQVHATRLSGDRLAVVAAGQAADAWVRWQTASGPTGNWAEWQQIPGTPLQPDGSKALSYVKLVRLSDDRLVVAGWTDGGAVYLSTQDAPGGRFGGWASLGGSGVRQGDVVRLTDDRLVIVSVFDGGVVQALVQSAPAGAWGAWSPLAGGGRSFSYATAVAKADDSVVVFATRAEAPTQPVYSAVSTAGAVGWSALSSVASGATGFARVSAVARPDGRLALFGTPEHGSAWVAVQTAAGIFPAWAAVTPTSRHEIGSVAGAVLRDGSLALLAHGAATLEAFAYQVAPDGEWVLTGGLPAAWTR